MYDPFTLRHPIQTYMNATKKSGPLPAKNGGNSNAKNGPKRRRNRRKKSKNESNSIASFNKNNDNNYAVAKGRAQDDRSNSRMTVIRRSEPIGEILGNTSSFLIAKALPINPGLNEMFAWLSIQASSWQYYRFRSLSFRYVPTCATTHSGLIIMVPEYNNSDSPPTSTSNAMANEDFVSGASYNPLIMKMDISKMFCQGPRKLVRNGVVMGDLNLYDSGIFYLITSGQASTVACGQLFVDYIVELSTPQTSLSLLPTSSKTCYYMLSLNQAITKDALTILAWNSVIANPLRLNAPLVGSFTLPNGAFFVTAMCCATNTTSEFSSGTLTIRLNGSRVGAECLCTSSRDETATGHNNSLQTSAIVVSSGDDFLTVTILIADTAASTCTAVASACFLAISPA